MIGLFDALGTIIDAEHNDGNETISADRLTTSDKAKQQD